MSPEEGFTTTMEFEAFGSSDGQSPIKFGGNTLVEGGDIVAGEYMQDPAAVHKSNFEESEWPEVVEEYYDPAVKAFEEIMAEKMTTLSAEPKQTVPVQVIHDNGPLSLPGKILSEIRDLIRRTLLI